MMLTATYTIQLRGQIELDDLNAMSPHQMTLIEMEPDATWLCVSTDQAGLVGLLVHLHHMGVQLKSIQWDEGLSKKGASDDGFVAA